jgi:hypothetical protein
MSVLLTMTNACKKEPSVRDLLLGSKWQVTDVCGPVSDKYTYTFKPEGQLVQEQEYMNTIYSTWSLKNNDKILVIGIAEENIISITKTEMRLKGFDLFDCIRIFQAIPF